MLRQNLKKLVPLQPILRNSFVQQSRALPVYSLIQCQNASTKANKKPFTPARRQRLVEVNTPFAKANKRLYVFPEDPFVASEKLTKILELGEVEDAEEYIRALPIYLQSVVIWNQLIGHCAKYGKAKFAERYYAQMRKRGIQPNDRTITQMLKAYAKSDSPNAVENAEAWFAKLQQFDIQPSIIHCNNLMRVYNNAGEPEKTIEFLKHLKRKGDVTPDAVTYTIALWACPNLTKMNQLEEIESIWNELVYRVDKRERKTNPSSSDSLLSQKASKIATSEKSIAVLNKIKEEDLKIDDELVIAMLNAISRSARSGKEAVVGLEVVERLYSLCPPRAAALMRENHISRKPGFGYEPSVKVLDSILRFAGKLREYKLGEQYFKLAKEQYPHLETDDRVYKSLAYNVKRAENSNGPWQRQK